MANPEIKQVILNSAKVLVGPKQVRLRGAADDFFDVTKASEVGVRLLKRSVGLVVLRAVDREEALLLGLLGEEGGVLGFEGGDALLGIGQLHAVDVEVVALGDVERLDEEWLLRLVVVRETAGLLA